MDNKSYTLSTFKKAVNDMVEKSIGGWNRNYGSSYSSIQRNYTNEDIENILLSGDIQQKRELSRSYFLTDGLYERIVLYYTTLLLFRWILVPITSNNKSSNNSFIKKKYNAALTYLSNINLEEFLTNITLNVLLDGAYYGIITTSNRKKLQVLNLPAQYCRSRFVDLDGNDVVEFNVAYFNTIYDKANREKVLRVYPRYIANYYRNYMSGKVTFPWVIVQDGGISFSLFEDSTPPFLQIVMASEQYNDTVDNEQKRQLDELRKIIIQQIPHLNDGTLLFEPEEAAVMHEGAVDMMAKNENVAVLTTYGNVDAIVSKTSADNLNNSLERMVQNVYTKAGVSGQLFSPTGSQSLEKSILNDIAFMMILGNKYSRFISKIVNDLFSNSNVKFNFKILPISYYNMSDYITDSFKLAQSGYSFLLPAIAIGINQQELDSLKDLENTCLNLQEKLIPLSSAYTHSSTDNSDGETKENGGQVKDIEDRSESRSVEIEAESDGRRASS